MPKINPKIKISEDDKEKLVAITKSRKHSADEIIRSKILLLFSEGKCSSKVATILNVSTKSTGNVYHRYFEGGINAALNDRHRTGRKPIRTQEDKLITINLACQKPKDLGYASEIWTQTKLAIHLQKTFSEKKTFANISQSSISRILEENTIKPFKIEYYINKRDPEFENKMINILNVYKEVEYGTCQNKITISIDEKTGLQAIKNFSDDKMPRAVRGAQKVPKGKLEVDKNLMTNWKIKNIQSGTILRDPEYKRLGTVSLIAGVNLNTGEIYGKTFDRHRSLEYIKFLKELDSKIDPKKTIRLIADNHIIHKSKETLKFFSTLRADRFETVFIPKHGSWLNAIEGIFSKMARGFLRGIRVESKDELHQRIQKGIEEMNEEKKPNNWSKFIKKFFSR